MGRGFNDLPPGGPVHTAEQFDPAAGTWTQLAAESVDRTTMLSAGGGEFLLGTTHNDPAGTHRDGRFFHPPYLFRGPRPEIVSAPDEIAYGARFSVKTPGPEISRVTILRLASLTHAFDQNQRIAALPFTPVGGSLTVCAPAEPSGTRRPPAGAGRTRR